MSTRLKQRAVTEFLSAENVTPAEILKGRSISFEYCYWG
jgi:hypothetical protein